MTRTHLKHYRAYVNGVDFSGYARQLGPLAWTFDAQPDAALTDSVKNALIGHGDIQAGPINAFMDNDSAGVFANRARALRNVIIAMGANTAPVAGDNIFAWEFEDIGYMAEPGDGFAIANLPLGGASSQGIMTYCKPWGRLLHAYGAETAANTGTGINDSAASTLGGIFVYHLFTSDNAVTLSVDDSADNSSFSALSGATSGSINASSSPQYGMVALSDTATVRQYLRFQIAMGAATTATFVSGFIRGTGA